MKPVLALLLCVILAACSDSAVMSPTVTPPFNAQVSYCAGVEPLWVAFQDGDGAWTRALPSTSNGNTVFQFSFSSNRGAIATVTDGGLGLTDLNVLYGTPSELESVGITSPRYCSPAVSKTLLGTVAGLGSNDIAFVRAGFASQAFVIPASGPDFALQVLPPGPRDILATRRTRINGDEFLTGIILRRSIDLPDGATLPVFDFGSLEPFAPSVANLSLQGPGVDGAFTTTRLRSSNMDAEVGGGATPAGGGPYYALPEARLLAGDLQVLTASTSGASPEGARSATVYFRAPTDRTLVLGAGLVPPVFATVATTPSLRLRAQFTEQSDYNRETGIAYQEGATTIVAVSMTPAYATRSGAGYDLVIPELGQVPGFNPAWALQAGQALRWSAVRIGGTLGLGVDPVPSVGDTRSAAVRGDVITP